MTGSWSTLGPSLLMRIVSTLDLLKIQEINLSLHDANQQGPLEMLNGSGTLRLGNTWNKTGTLCCSILSGQGPLSWL